MVVEQGRGEGICGYDAPGREQGAGFGEELHGHQVLGDVVAAVRVEEHQIVAFAPGERALHEDARIAHMHPQAVVRCEPEVRPRSRYHGWIDFGDVDPGLGHQFGQGGGQRAAAQSRHEHAAGLRCQEQRRHHHARVREHHALGRTRVHARLVAFAVPEGELHAQPRGFLGDEDGLVQRPFAVHDLLGARRPARQSENHTRRGGCAPSRAHSPRSWSTCRHDRLCRGPTAGHRCQ